MFFGDKHKHKYAQQEEEFFSSKCNYHNQKMHVRQDNENAYPWM
jgi:hypothetical protein